MADWTFDDAETRLGRIADQADREGPQRIIDTARRGAMLLSTRDYQRLVDQAERRRNQGD